MTVRPPLSHLERYRELAAKEGLSVSEFVVRACARATGLEFPDDDSQGEGLQQELPIGA